MPLGIGDDAALVEPERNRLDVLSVDALVEVQLTHDERYSAGQSQVGGLVIEAELRADVERDAARGGQN